MKKDTSFPVRPWLAPAALALAAFAPLSPAADAPEPLWLAVDMRGGRDAASWPVEWVQPPPGGASWDEEYKTSRLLLRRIEPGTFEMGSPPGEAGRLPGETQHAVTLTKPYCIGVFEVTQRQWELAMGPHPTFCPDATRPADRMAYDAIRGSADGSGWPRDGRVDSDSFMGVLRARTGLAFDLPTEAQWEYACRAGTSTALNNGKELTGTDVCPNAAETAHCLLNMYDGPHHSLHHTRVGCYLPNAWGLHDMHGNVWEWCLDWLGPYPSGPATDPVGPPGGTRRVIRGGGASSPARHLRSASRRGAPPSYDAYTEYGFRAACPVPPSAAPLPEDAP